MVLLVVLGHEVEPAFERVQPAASASRHGEALGEVGDAADVAGRCRMLERLLDRADLERPGPPRHDAVRAPASGSDRSSSRERRSRTMRG